MGELGYFRDPLWVRQAFRLFDVVGRTYVDALEFVGGLGMVLEETPISQKAAFLFHCYDRDGNNELSLSELVLLFSIADVSSYRGALDLEELVPSSESSPESSDVEEDAKNWKGKGKGKDKGKGKGKGKEKGKEKGKDKGKGKG